MSTDTCNDQIADSTMAQLDHWEAELFNELHQLLELEPTETTHAHVTAVVNQLFTLLPLQFDAKTCGGYLQDVEERYPSWDIQVNALLLEQAFLYEELREIRDRLQEGEHSIGAVKAQLPLLTEWTRRLQAHEEEERRLSQVAVNLDVGEPGG